MSAPEAILLCRGDDLPPQFEGFPHRLAFLPKGVGPSDIGSVGNRTAGIFLIEPGCSHVTLNDPAFAGYLQQRVLIIAYARRPKDLRPFLRRADSLLRRMYSVEVLP